MKTKKILIVGLVAIAGFILLRNRAKIKGIKPITSNIKGRMKELDYSRYPVGGKIPKKGEKVTILNECEKKRDMWRVKEYSFCIPKSDVELPDTFKNYIGYNNDNNNNNYINRNYIGNY